MGPSAVSPLSIGEPLRAVGFPAAERKFLLMQPRIGAQVVARLERAGFHSLRQLQHAGAATSVLHICEGIDSIAWANRRRPLEQALARWAEDASASSALQSAYE